MPNARPPLAAVILAAGKGTRMRSARHKVLHPLGGRPMLLHLLAGLDALAPERRVVVVGDRAEQLEAALEGSGVALAVQAPQLGTGHAVLQAEAALAGFEGVVLILFGDVPLLKPETMARLADAVAVTDGPAIAVLGFRPAVPGAYGRILADADGRIERMVEAKDATPQELAVPLCNSGLMAVASRHLMRLLRQVGNANAAGEYYLPDIVMLARAEGLSAIVLEGAVEELVGVNSRAELAAAEALFQAGRRAELMAAGVSMVAPETVFVAHDTELGPDCLVEPFVVFGPGVRAGEGVTIRAHSHLEGATLAAGCEVGPFARLRPGTVLGERARIGNFVETKKAVLGAGAKANHLAYLGDAEVGAGANIGAGTITCNYDGFLKYNTVIGDGAFIGSNSALVAPVSVGAGAIVGAGSVITRDVAADALAIARGEQVAREGRAAQFRATMQARKTAAKRKGDD
jgi:bifunctional UDP-N-acetylglucosamine pyrophosphorylase/glucosamine-1-phosphate N-acetyltransferase